MNDLFNKKPITPEAELQETIDEIMQDITLLGPNPYDWERWVTYIGTDGGGSSEAGETR